MRSSYISLLEESPQEGIHQKSIQVIVIYVFFHQTCAIAWRFFYFFRDVLSRMLCFSDVLWDNKVGGKIAIKIMSIKFHFAT